MQVDKYMYFHRPDYKWIESLIKKYPVISGKPLDKEDAIDLNEIHEPEVSRCISCISGAANITNGYNRFYG